MDRETIGMLREHAAREQKKAQRKFLARKVATVYFLATVNQFWWAQLVVWGLSLYHVQSGFWGPFLLLEALGSLVATAVCIGMLLTAQRMSED